MYGDLSSFFFILAFILLAHQAKKVKVNYCYSNASDVLRALCVVRRPSTMENNLFNHCLL